MIPIRSSLSSLVAPVALAFLLAPFPSEACNLCAFEAGEVDCELVVGETGGSGCYINCRTTPAGMQKCYCRTLGLCAGSNDCNGSPCPTLADGETGVAKRLASPWLTPTPSVALPRATLEAVFARYPDVETLLSAVVRETGALSALQRDWQPLLLGPFSGALSEVPVEKKGVPGAGSAYGFRGDARLEGAKVRVWIEVADHPQIRRLTADFVREPGLGFLEIEDAEGAVERFEL